MSKGDREELLNSLANKFGIKVEDINKKKQPLHIEMVRDNFNQIVSTLKVYELKQV
jgi:acetolactate synthase small subunit